MARYEVTVCSPMAPAEAFAYMADLNNFAEWDPGVTKVEQVEGEGSGPDAVFDVTVKGVPSDMTLRYRTIAYDAPNSLTAKAKSSLLTSVDTVTVRSDGKGSQVSYAADLTLNGVLALADPLLGLAFKRIGDRAAAGLVKALNGERVATPSS